uniref:Putative salivary protein antigen p23 n=1 Tax=Ixodes ricinus TaxID=34613 RepID=A0A0K8RFJ0_IXORI
MLRIVGLVFVVIAVETAKAQRYEDVRDFLGLLENDGTKANGVTVTDSNVFVDTVLSQRVPAIIRTTPSLYPAAQIPFHNFKIKKTGLGIRDLKVNLTEGAVRGLDTLVRRVGDCNRPIQVAGNTSITCTLDLSGLNVTYTAQTKGDNVLSTRKTIWVHVAVRNTTARFEATANPGKDGSVRTFLVEQITLSASYDSNLDLNQERSRAFRSEVRNYTNAELYKILYGSYLTVLNQAVAGTFFPRA